MGFKKLSLFSPKYLMPSCLKPKKLLKGSSSSSSSSSSNGIQTSKKISLRRISSFSDMSVRSSLSVISDLSNSCIGSNLQIFTFNELKELTQCFIKSNYLGEGGFGPVFKGFIGENFKPGLKSQQVAVKILDLDGSQGHREWLVNIILMLL